MPPGAAPAVRGAALAALALLAGCAIQYDLTLMPRDSGKLAYGTALDLGNGTASVSIGLGDRVYNGSWVQVTPEYGTSYVGASAWGWRRWGPFGEADRSYGDATAKALLQASDGSGLRCDFFGLTGGKGTGKCTDDKNLTYDVQITARNYK